ncbi:MAG: hypothetical protein LBO69_09390 [Ignavibacteria bacterium]|jgi:tetratricopeptide (TPR) repeat protein|nr:hypothetical protein [Ignavibacteria bacterium]
MKKLKIIILVIIAIILSSCTSKEKEAKELCKKGWEFIKKGEERVYIVLYDKANDCFDKALAIIITPEAYAGKAYYYVLKKNFDEAIVWATRSLAIDSVNNSKGLYVKGEIAREQKDYKIALYYYQKQLEASNNDTDKALALRKISVAYWWLGENDKYFKFCEKAYELNPTDKFIMNNLAVAYHIRGYYEKSNDIYDKVIAANFEKYTNAMVWTNKATNFSPLGMYAAAIFCCKKALEINPDYTPATFMLGRTFYYAKQYDSALIYLDKAREVDSTYCDIYSTKGETYQAMGKKYYPQAIAEYEKAIKYDAIGAFVQQFNDSIASVKRQMRK